MFVQHIESLYVFAVWMLGDRQAAFEAMRSVLDKPPAERLPALAVLLTGNKRPTGRINRFDELDGILRTNTTVPIELGHPLVHGDPQRLAVLLSELQRTCLMATVRGLPPQRRAAWGSPGKAIVYRRERCGRSAGGRDVWTSRQVLPWTP